MIDRILPEQVKTYEKTGMWYAVINYTDTDGKYKKMWRATGMKKTGKKIPAAVTAAVNKLAVTMAQELNQKLFGDIIDDDIQFGNYLDMWIEERKPNIQLTTYESYAKYIRGIKRHKALNKPINEISYRDVNKLYAEIRKTDVSENTVLHYHTLLKSVFKYALAHEHISKDPMLLIERPKKDAYHAKTLTDKEINTVLNMFKNDSMYIAIIFAILFGMRRSELCGLMWSDVDFTKTKNLPYGSITVNRKAISTYGTGKETVIIDDELKTEASYRTLPLNEYTREILLNYKKQQNEWKKLAGESWNKEWEGFICRNSIGKLISPGYVTDHWGNIRKKAGVKVKFHELRHTFATLQLKNGTDLKRLQRWLGHSNISTTGNIYSHVTTQDLTGLADTMSKMITDNTSANN